MNTIDQILLTLDFDAIQGNGGPNGDYCVMFLIQEKIQRVNNYLYEQRNLTRKAG